MKLWLTLIVGPGSLEDLKELWEPIAPYFNGFSVVCHAERGSDVATYLEEHKKEGVVTYLPYVGRHDFSRSACIYCGPIKQGDWVTQVDLLERVPASFAANLLPFILNLQDQHVNAVYYYGKIYVYEFHESMVFRGTPHEGLIRQDGQMRAIELSKMYPNEADIRLNVRPLKRLDPKGWVMHYLRYYIECPWGGNHCLLGNEARGDPMKLYQEREVLRIRFRDHLRDSGIPLKVEAVKEFLTKPLDDVTREVVNNERILNDVYRWFILHDETVVDDHTWKGMIKV